MSGQHAPYAPSSMARIVQCPGSVGLSALYPEDDDGPEAREGTAAHWVMAHALCNGGALPALGSLAPNGEPVTDEMHEGAALACSEVVSWGATAYSVEQRVTIPRVHADCWGTPDVAAWVVPGRRLRVLDYKFGHGFVDAYENWQLMAYAAGLLEALEPGGDVECIVELTVVQPRNYHRDGPVRTWTTTGGKLRTQINIMANACDEAAGPNPGMHVGPECKHCPAARACPQLQAAALDACDLAQKAIPLELPNAAAGLELQRVQRALKLLEARASGLEAQVVEAIKRGEQVPRWHLEAAEGRESWSIPLDEVKALGMLYGAPVTKEVPITPNQARKLGVVTDGFSQRPRGASKLVPDGNTAARVFGG